MSEKLFARMLESYEALPFAGKAVALQGGEPLLATPEILARLNDSRINKSLQTNATLITDETAAMLGRGNWLVGVSIDGDELANRLRTKPGGSRAFDDIVNGIRRLERAGVDYNLMTVVSRANVDRAAEIYRYLRDNFSTRYHQYIECTGSQAEIDSKQWGRFLIELFDEWIANDARTVSIRIFDSIVSTLLGGPPTQCSFAGTCRQYLVVEHDGNVYPCDFHVRDDLKLGNIATHSWRELSESPVYQAFADGKAEGLPDECRQCEFFIFCRGDCPRNRVGGNPRLCAGWKQFFAHSLPKLRKLLQTVRGN